MKKVINCSNQSNSSTDAFWKLHESCYNVGMMLEDAAEALDLEGKVFDSETATEADYNKILEKAEETNSWSTLISELMRSGNVGAEDAVEFLENIIAKNNIQITFNDIAKGLM